MLIILYIAICFGILNILFLFAIIILNELFILAVSNMRITLIILVLLAVIGLLVFFSPQINPLDFDILTILIILGFSTTSFYVAWSIYKNYRRRIACKKIERNAVCIEELPQKRDSFGTICAGTISFVPFHTQGEKRTNEQ